MVLFLMPGKLYFSQNGGIMNLSVNFAGIEMKNPVTVASGTFGYGREFSEFIDLNKLRRGYNKRNITKTKTRK